MNYKPVMAVMIAGLFTFGAALAEKPMQTMGSESTTMTTDSMAGDKMDATMDKPMADTMVKSGDMSTEAAMDKTMEGDMEKHGTDAMETGMKKSM